MRYLKKGLVLLLALLMLCGVSVTASAASSAGPKVTVTNTASSGKSKLKWSKVKGAKKYYVYRSENGEADFKKVKTTTSTSYTDSSASVGKTYYYKVKANGKYSQVISAVRICAQPDLNVKIASATGLPALSWDGVSGADEYRVFRAESKEGEYILLAATRETEYQDTSAQPNTKYWYRVDVIGETAGTDSMPETPVSVQTTCAKPVLSFDNEPVSGDPVISWEAVDGAAEYKIYRSTKSGSGFKLVKTTADTNWQDAKATAGKKYYYKVRAYCSEDVKSAYSSVKSGYSACAQPKVELTVTEKGAPKLSWSKVSGAKKYKIYRAAAEGGEFEEIKTTTSTKFTDAAAKTDQAYFYRVRALASNSAANSADGQVLFGKLHTHSFTPVITEPDCLNGGYTEYFCECGDAYRDGETPALGHDYTAAVTAPTCEEGGYTLHTCTRCGDSYKDGETAALGHQYAQSVVASTCTEGGYTRYTCSCGAQYKDGETEALGHDYVSKVTEPACEQAGSTTHTCQRCRDTYTDGEVPATGHVKTSTETKKATCVEDGWEKEICDACGAQVGETKKLAANGKHSYETAVVSTAAKQYANYWGYGDYDKYLSYSDIECDRCKNCYDIDDDSFRIKYSQNEIASTMLGYVNSLREKNGLNKLKISSTLNNLADTRSKEIVTSFNHGGSRGYDENITKDGGVSNCIKKAYNAFYNSSGHRAIMLSEEYEYFGCDIYYSGGKTYCVQVFD